MAVAGFSPAELDITVQENTLLVTRKAQKEDENGGGYLHRGITRRAFERRFSPRHPGPRQTTALTKSSDMRPFRAIRR
jgi:HSP20 family molecular chaperone IbpA